MTFQAAVFWIYLVEAERLELRQSGFEPKILEWLGDAKIMNPDTILILETSLDTPVDYVDTEQFEIVRIKEYKNNQHVFLRAK